MIYDVVIVGGGASGLMCANFLRKDQKIAIIDKSELGKKLLVTGNGRCNLTNKNIEAKNYSTSLVKQFLEQFDLVKTIEFFKSIGIEIFFDEEGRGYPVSETAKDVQDALLSGIDGVQNIKGEVIKIEKRKDFEITLLSGDKISSKKIVIASGCKNLENILKGFNLKFEQNKRVLTGFEVKSFDKNLFGVRENAIVRAKSVNFQEIGQVQFKKDGISGIVIFNLSAKVAKDGNLPFEVSLELLPNISSSELKGLLGNRKSCKNLKKRQILIGLLKPEMAKYILKISSVSDLDSGVNELSDADVDRIVESVKDLKFICLRPYDDCQVLSGGVDLKNLKDLQAIKDLYLCGEATNVFGVCGGYNLQWAWSSGYCVAKKINKE